jgi:monothiol glutaredoxin
MSQNVQDWIREQVNQNRVVLFMKGTRSFPQCGFSKAVVDILDGQNVPYKDINVLADPAVRQGIKDFSNWPTIPQLYVDGKFIGGCDIAMEMASSGELTELLAAKQPA